RVPWRRTAPPREGDRGGGAARAAASAVAGASGLSGVFRRCLGAARAARLRLFFRLGHRLGRGLVGNRLGDGLWRTLGGLGRLGRLLPPAPSLRLRLLLDG